MNERRARCSLEEKYSVPGAEKEYDARHEDYVMEMPPPGERIRGREKMRAFQESFPDHSNILRRFSQRMSHSVEGYRYQASGLFADA